jgi:hypothetical protein
MAMQLGHVHIKTKEDPQKVAKFYIDNFGATVKREIPGRGCQLERPSKMSSIRQLRRGLPGRRLHRQRNPQ